MKNIFPLQNPKKIGYLTAFVAAILFGSVSTIAKPNIETIHPLILSFIVYLLASVVSTPFSRTSFKNLSKQDLKLIISIAITGAVLGPALFFWGLKDSTASDAGILINGEIIFSVIIALSLFGERLNRFGIIAIVLIFTGLFIVTTNLEISNQSFDWDTGNPIILLATIFWAIDNNLSKILSKRIPLAKIVQLKSALGAIILLIIIGILGIPFEITIEQIPSLLILGGAGFGLSIYLFLYSLKKIGTVRTIMIFSTSSVFSLIFASVLLNESISNMQIAAVGIMIAGIYLLQKKNT